MNTIQFNTDEIRPPNEVYNIFKDENLKKGDKIEVLTAGEKFAILVVVFMAIVWYFMKELKEEKAFGDKVLDNLFANKSGKELERESEQAYGIHIEVERKKTEQH